MLNVETICIILTLLTSVHPAWVQKSFIWFFESTLIAYSFVEIIPVIFAKVVTAMIKLILKRILRTDQCGYGNWMLWTESFWTLSLHFWSLSRLPSKYRRLAKTICLNTPPTGKANNFLSKYSDTEEIYVLFNKSFGCRNIFYFFKCRIFKFLCYMYKNAASKHVWSRTMLRHV